MQCTVEEAKNICIFPTGQIEYPTEDMDEVYPGIYIGNASSAGNLERLKELNIGYILNASYGMDFSLKMIEVLPEEIYNQAGITFLGVSAIDMMSFQINQYFKQSSNFIWQALHSGKNILVHCVQGISRSATLVLAYLVQEVGMDLQDAVQTVRQRREILPNDGFLLQLCDLNENRPQK